MGKLRYLVGRRWGRPTTTFSTKGAHMLAQPEPMTAVLGQAPIRRPRATSKTANAGTGARKAGASAETVPAPQSAVTDERAEQIRAALLERLAELTAEHADAMAELEIAGLVDAGDDVADLGTKAFTREQEIVLVTTMRGRIDQVERALGRVAEGRYGWCESCAEEIPVARLTAFPSVTLCVRCKQLEERR
jgi:DnaK suppressor protein